MDHSQYLRENVRMLGEILGRVLKHQGGPSLLSTVEDIRTMAKSARHGDVQAWTTLSEKLSTLQTKEAIPICRAFALFLALANITRAKFETRIPGYFQSLPNQISKQRKSI